MESKIFWIESDSENDIQRSFFQVARQLKMANATALVTDKTCICVAKSIATLMKITLFTPTGLISQY